MHQDQVKLQCSEYILKKKRALDAKQRQEQEYAEYVLEQDRVRYELEEEIRGKKDDEARLCQIENME